MRFAPFWVYSISLIVAACGLWAVLVAGSHLSAVQDLSGTWTLRPLNAADSAAAPSGQLRIEQSGQYMWLFAGDTRADLRLIDAPPQPSAKAHYLLAGDKASATFELIEMPDVWKLTLVGLSPGIYRATREAPPPTAGQEPASQAGPSALKSPATSQ
jgi:hypothetical protein